MLEVWMVYKKYIKRDGKIYGPYAYKSRKENGKVITDYVGKHHEKFSGSEWRSLILFFGLLLVFSSVIFLNHSLTGRVALQVQDNYLAGEQINGNLELSLKYGELIPSGTKILIENGGEISEYFLSDFISENIAEGKFYSEGNSLPGEGSGYGVIGEKKIYPGVYFELLIVGKGVENAPEEKPVQEKEIPEESVNESVEESESEVEQPEVIEEETSGESENSPEESSEKVEEVSDEEEKKQETKENKEKEQQKEEKSEEKESKKDTASEESSSSSSEGSSQDSSSGNSESSSSESSSSESSSGGESSGSSEGSSSESSSSSNGGESSGESSSSGITGEVIGEENKNVVEGKVSGDNPFVYELPEDKSAKIKPESVRTDLEKLSDGDVKLKISGTTATVTTDYFQTEKGFGEDYITNDKITFDIDLSHLGLVAEQGQLVIKLVYEDNEIVSVSKEISVQGEEPEIPEQNETEVPENITEIPEQNITQLQNVTEQNITEQNITEIPTINVTTQENLSVLQYKAIAGKPVKWIKVIKTTNESDFVEIPKKSNNISIKTGEEVQQALSELETYENTIDNNKDKIADGTITGFVSLDIKENKGFIQRLIDWFSNLGITGNVIQEHEIIDSIIETDESKIVDVDKVLNYTEGLDVAVEYYTEPTSISEEVLTNGKRIVISSFDEFNYTDILAYTLIDNSVSMNNLEKIKLLWNENGNSSNVVVNFTVYDLDSDGNVDYIEWIVPHLSEQVYELIYITKAEHLDSNRTFISDIYDDVKSLDGNWSEVINDSEYVRVTFEQALDNTKDITIYARSVDGISSIGVYAENSDELITTFENVAEENTYKIYLTNLPDGYSQSVFDLKVSSVSGVEFDYIVDPILIYNTTSDWNGTFDKTHDIGGDIILKKTATPTYYVGGVNVSTQTNWSGENTFSITYDIRDNSVWTMDLTDRNVTHVSLSTYNAIAGGFAVPAGVGSPFGLVLDTSDYTWWILDSLADNVTHTSSTGTPIAGGFRLAVHGNANPYGIIYDDRDDTLWIGDTTDDFFYHYDMAGTNLTDGFSVQIISADVIYGICLDPRDYTFWGMEATGSNFFMHHYTFGGTNLSDGFLLTTVPNFNANPGCAIDTRDYSFWIVDNLADSMSKILVPYNNPGSYLSLVENAGFDANWTNITWSDNESNANVNISVQVRSCDDAACSGESFGDFIQSGTLSNLNVANNQYFQYNVSFQTANTNLTAILYNLSVEYVSANTAPTTPNLNQPLNNTNWSSIPQLNWSNSTDSDGDAITYSLEVDDNNDFSSVTYSNYSISETTNTTGDTPTSLSDATYYWRVLAQDGTENSSWSEYRVFILDTTNPNVSLLTETPSDPATYSGSGSYEFNATINDSGVGVDSVLFEFNSVNYTPTQTGIVYNFSISNLAVGTYNYRWIANDTLGYVNNTETGTYTIDKATPTATITSTDVWTLTYPNEVTIGLSESNNGDGDVTYVIYRDNVSILTGETITLGVGYYEYVLNTTGGENYSASFLDGENLTINQGTGIVNLTFDKATPQTYGNKINATCEVQTGEGTAVLTLNGATITSGTLSDLNASTHNFNCSMLATQNYTGTSNLTSFVINKNVTSGTLSGTTPLTYGQTGDVEGTETNTGDGGITYTLYRNNVSVSNPDATLLGAASWTYTYNATAGENYTSNSSLAELTITINQNSSLGLSVSISPSTSETYGTETNATGSGCPSQLSCVLFRNGTSTGAETEVTTLGVATYNYTYNTTGNENYTIFQVDDILIISKFTQNFTPLLNGDFQNLTTTYKPINASYTGTNYTFLNISIISPLNASLTPGENASYGVENYTLNYSLVSNENYTGLEFLLYANLSPANGEVAGYLGGTRGNRSVDTQTTTMNFSANRVSGETNITMHLNGSLINNGSIWISNVTSIGVGIYELNASIPASQNYTAYSENWTLNVTQYVAPTTTTTTTGGSSGGGGGSAAVTSEFILGSPSYETTLAIGKTESAGIKVTNAEDEEKTFAVSQTNLDGILFLKQDSFKLAAKDSANIDFDIVAPSLPGLYTGKILVRMNSVVKQILISINVNTEKSLYDLVVTIPKGSKTIQPGDHVFAQIDMLQAGLKESMDVTLNYVIKDYSGVTHFQESDTIQVYDRKTYNKEFITSNLPQGDYVLGVELIYPAGVAVASSQFAVQEKIKATKEKIILTSLIIAILIVFVSIWFSIKRYKKKKR
ncbi:MAG: hypothetical protein Q8P15_03270 [Nanoarchaeota archaeon]|nr:hypothetical protein [Nanoarchaeota archaeon]